MTDFQIYQLGRHYVVYARTERAMAWFHDHWRSPDDPPNSRATKVARLLSEIVLWWEVYPPGYTVQMDSDIAADLKAAGDILI
jgi:hypothetical protein